MPRKLPPRKRQTTSPGPLLTSFTSINENSSKSANPVKLKPDTQTKPLGLIHDPSSTPGSSSISLLTDPGEAGPVNQTSTATSSFPEDAYPEVASSSSTVPGALPLIASGNALSSMAHGVYVFKMECVKFCTGARYERCPVTAEFVFWVSDTKDADHWLYCSTIPILEIIEKNLRHRFRPQPSVHLHGRKTRSSASARATSTGPFPLLNHRMYTIYGVDTKSIFIISTVLTVETSMMAISTSKAGSYQYLAYRPSRLYMAYFDVSKRPSGPDSSACSDLQQLVRL